MPVPWQKNVTSLPSKRKMTNYGVPPWPSSQRTTSPSLWLHQWTPSLITPTSVDGGNFHQISAPSAARLGDKQASKQTRAHFLSHCQAAMDTTRPLYHAGNHCYLKRLHFLIFATFLISKCSSPVCVCVLCACVFVCECVCLCVCMFASLLCMFI